MTKRIKIPLTIKEYCIFWDIPVDDLGNTDPDLSQLFDFEDDDKFFKK